MNGERIESAPPIARCTVWKGWSYHARMEHREMGRTGMRASVLGFGGAEIGYGRVPVDEVAAILGEALDAGLNVIDTAECYLDCEEKIGATVSHRRKDFLLFTKVGHADGYGPNEDWSIAGITRSIDRSLQRLKTDRVDLVQLHSCNREILERDDYACVRALEAARQAGKTRFIGYSGDGDVALAAVRTGRFDVLQTSVNVADQQVLDMALPEALARGMGVIAKRPIANAAWLRSSVPEGDYSWPYWDRLRELAYPWLTLGTAEAVGVALRFTLSQPGVHTAIVGTSRRGRWAENAAMLSAGPLPGAEIQTIRARWREVAKTEWIGQV